MIKNFISAQIRTKTDKMVFIVILLAFQTNCPINYVLKRGSITMHCVRLFTTLRCEPEKVIFVASKTVAAIVK